VRALTDVMIILDSREWTGAGDLLENPLEDSIRIASSAIRTLLLARNRVGLVIIGDSVRYVRPSGGEKHFLYLLHELAAVSPQGQVPLLKALKVSSKYFTPSSPLILISPLSEGLDAKEALEYLISLGHPLTVISPDPLEREARILGVKPPRYYLKKIERSLVLSTLSQTGAKVVDVPPSPDIAGLLKEVMG
ncbi:MAG: hypothetical protein J7L88_06550, partial [Thermoplasmata archaeon]|nr:hypothetical protein [Thermoplasmata archaeon]